MHRILLICFLIAGFPIPGFEQSSLYVTQYYPAVNRAELAIVRSDYAAALREYRVNTDQHLRTTLETMHWRDQEFRLKDGSYAVYGDTIRKIDSLLGRYSQAGTG